MYYLIKYLWHQAYAKISSSPLKWFKDQLHTAVKNGSPNTHGIKNQNNFENVAWAAQWRPSQQNRIAASITNG